MLEWQIIEVLSRRYSPPEWAFLPHVADGTGGNKRRTADALAMNLWPSRGLSLIGIEIKVNRSDWLKELKEPAKAESIAQYCNFWYVATHDPGIIKDGELPSGWGLMQVKKKVKVLKEAPELQPVLPDLPFLAAVLRKAAECITPTSALKEQYEQGEKAADEYWKIELKISQDEIRRLRADIQEFEEKSGVVIRDWKHGNLGKSVRLLLEGDDVVEKYKRSLQRLLDQSREITQKLEKIIGEEKQETE